MQGPEVLEPAWERIWQHTIAATEGLQLQRCPTDPSCHRGYLFFLEALRAQAPAGGLWRDEEELGYFLWRRPSWQRHSACVRVAGATRWFAPNLSFQEHCPPKDHWNIMNMLDVDVVVVALPCACCWFQSDWIFWMPNDWWEESCEPHRDHHPEWGRSLRRRSWLRTWRVHHLHTLRCKSTTTWNTSERPWVIQHHKRLRRHWTSSTWGTDRRNYHAFRIQCQFVFLAYIN